MIECLKNQWRENDALRNNAKSAFYAGALTAAFVVAAYGLSVVTPFTFAALMLTTISFVAPMAVLSWFFSDRIIKHHFKDRMREITANETNPVLRAAYEDTKELIQDEDANLPIPQLYVIDDPRPNAFATGRSHKRGFVGLTRGLLEQLDREEVKAVIAHELAHIKHYDGASKVITGIVGAALGLVALNAYNHFSNNLGRARDGKAFLIRVAATAISYAMAHVFVPILRSITSLGLSRMREYEADRVGAKIADNPIALATALKKISSQHRPTKKQEEADQLMSMFYIYNPTSSLDDQTDENEISQFIRGVQELFSTHPRTQKRIDELVQQAEEMGMQIDPHTRAFLSQEIRPRRPQFEPRTTPEGSGFGLAPSNLQYI